MEQNRFSDTDSRKATSLRSDYEVLFEGTLLGRIEDRAFTEPEKVDMLPYVEGTLLGGRYNQDN